MLKLKHTIFYITTTRFNNTTFKQNERYRLNHNIEGCIYAVPNEMPNYIPIKSKVFVLEMNNDKNKIMGIGYLYNRPYIRKHKIYQDMNYNRYSYVGKHRVDRHDMTETQIQKLSLLEEMVFKGKGHLKRGQGITSVPQKKICQHKEFIIKFMIELFVPS